MKEKNKTMMGLLILGVIIWIGAAQAAPVPVTSIYCDPGFESSTTTNKQTIVYIAVGNDGYEVTGATCTYCPTGSRAGTTNDIPATNSDALSGSVITHAVLNISTGLTAGAKFDLGMTVTNDNIGIVLGEIGSFNQTGDPINVYPLTNGVRVGRWVRRIESSDYGKLADNQMSLYYSNYSVRQTLCPFMTIFRHSDFTNDAGTLTFTGIEINDTKDYDPNIVATIADALTVVTHKLPVTGMTFSPGFDENPELDGQTLTSLTTAEGTFSNISGLRCVSAGGSKFGALAEGIPNSTTNALSGLKFTQGVANIGTGDWVLGQAVNGTDTSLRFFFGEINVYNQSNPDSVIITPFINGTLSTEKTLVIASGNYGVHSPLWKNTYLSDAFYGTVVSFSLADFNTSPFDQPLANVTGFRVSSGTADPNIFGTYKIPLKGTIVVIY